MERKRPAGGQDFSLQKHGHPDINLSTRKSIKLAGLGWPLTFI